MRSSRIIQSVSVRDRQACGRVSVLSEDVHVEGSMAWTPETVKAAWGERSLLHGCFSNNDVLRLGYLIWKEDEKCHGELSFVMN
jgi:hypothetical protein